MPKVERRKRESFESMLKRFKKSVDNAGILTELRKREHYERPSVKRKRKAAAAKKREYRRMNEELNKYKPKRRRLTPKRKRSKNKANGR